MEEKIGILRGLGFSEAQVARMCKVFPNLLCLSARRIEEAWTNLLSLGFTEDEARDLMFDTPSIFGMATQTVAKKIKLLQEIFGCCFCEVLGRNPKRLIQGYEETKRRYQVLKYLNLPCEKLERELFLPKKQFESKYGTPHIKR